MLDIETLGTRPGSVITVIGAIKFSEKKRLNENMHENCFENLDTFYRRINIDSCVDNNFFIESDTKEWWDRQDRNIKYEALINPDRTHIIKVLQEFSRWLGDTSKLKIWGNGSSFDCAMLSEAYNKCGIKIPWKFWLERDLRTIMDLGNIKIFDLPDFGKHHALYDCYRQIIGFHRSIDSLQN